MDRPFVKKMCESYYIDKQLDQSKIWNNKESCINELINEINAIIINTKIENDETYYESISYSRRHQQETIYNLLNEYLEDKYNAPKENVIREDFTGPEMMGLTGLFFGLASLVTAKWYGEISRAGYRIVNAFGKLNDKIHSFLKKRTAESRMKYAMLVSHLNICQRKCGIDNEKSLGATVGMGLTGQALSGKSQTQANCIADCFLKYSIEQLKVLAGAYVDCLKNTGEKIEHLSDVSILLSKPMGDQCREYYDFLEKFNSDFREVLDVLFKENPRKRQDYMNLYNEILNDVARGGSRR